MVLCPPFPNKEQDTGPIILVIIILQKIRYTAKRREAKVKGCKEGGTNSDNRLLPYTI